MEEASFSDTHGIEMLAHGESLGIIYIAGSVCCENCHLLSVKPGLSGMWQISGRSDTGYEERINLDTYYIQNWSVWLDIWILIKTVGVVIKGKGAY